MEGRSVRRVSYGRMTWERKRAARGASEAFSSSRNESVVQPGAAMVPLRFITRTAWGALGRHPLRAGLTMIGIAVGIAAVIALVSLGEGAKEMVIERLATMGDNMLQVEAGNRAFRGASTPAETLTYDDVLAIRKE